MDWSRLPSLATPLMPRRPGTGPRRRRATIVSAGQRIVNRLVRAAALGGGIAGLAAAPATPLHRDDFRGDLRQWVVEQQPGGRVFVESGRLVIADSGGATVWFRAELIAPVIIRYDVTVASSARVSDLNCFWMASHASAPQDLFAADRPRSGRFADYDGLRTYYVGYGGNNNSTTRFRRYDGSGARPLAPDHDLRSPDVLLRPDHRYRIELRALADGRVQFWRDGEKLFDIVDPEPLTRGWFGFRTVNSRLEISTFEVLTPDPDATPSPSRPVGR